MKKHVDKILIAIGMLFAVAALVISCSAPFTVFNGSYSFNWIDLYLGTSVNIDGLSITIKQAPAKIIPIVFIIVAVIIFGIMVFLGKEKLAIASEFCFGGLAFGASIVYELSLLQILSKYSSYLFSTGWGAILAAYCASMACLLGITAGALKVVQFKRQRQSLLQK